MIHCWPTVIAVVKHAAVVTPAVVKHAAVAVGSGIAGFGKNRRHYMRHAWNMSHRGAKRVYYGTMITCVTVPGAIAEMWRMGVFDRLGGGDTECCVPGQFDVINVPEPSTLAIFTVGLLAITVLRLRRRH